ncbi:MAG: signal peptidase I [Anaerolineae bacterium]
MPVEDSVRFYHGRSMGGTFRPGDCLTVEPVSLADVRPGDVVVYRGPNDQGDTEELVHRVVAAAPGGLVAHGDNNPCADMPLVTADNLLGRVTHVERDGRTRLVRGGRLGLLHARVLHARRHVWRQVRGLVACLGRGPYRWLRESGLVPRLWQPTVMKVRLATENGPLVKYVCGGRTVARWWPHQNRFECQKPYDLVIPRPDGAE